tara:strand:- start:27088 stop:27402 length:315 start_codon:yes stop_codon:yes gene_type:complete
MDVGPILHWNNDSAEVVFRIIAVGIFVLFPYHIFVARIGFYTGFGNCFQIFQIEGMEYDERRKTLEYLRNVIESPQNVYEHIWQPGDILVWDNQSCVHARTDWP